MTFSLDLDFIKPGKRSGFPDGAHANIYVKCSHSFDRPGPRGDLRYITPDCVRSGELDYEIDRLHRELENIRRRARHGFSRTAKK